MRRRIQIIPFIVVFFCFFGKAFGTGDSIHILTVKDTIFIQKDSLGINFFYHQVEPKQTMYSICRFYGLKQKQLQELNPALKVRGIQIGELVKVPISAKLIRVSALPLNNVKYSPIFYEVMPGEGLNKISRNYFAIKPEKLMQINGMTSPELKLGQLLLIGWIPLNLFNEAKSQITKDTKKEEKLKTKAPIPSKDLNKDKNPSQLAIEKDIAKANVADAVEKVEKEEALNTSESNKIKFEKSERQKIEDQGIAFWHKEMRGNKGLYVLHRNAPRGSVIKISNPMFGTTVYAKVAGSISANAYPDEVMIVVSPEIADKLRARDARFFAKISYLR